MQILFHKEPVNLVIKLAKVAVDFQQPNVFHAKLDYSY